MAEHELLTDDYVAGLLAREAQDCALKYSTMGLEAYQTSKPSNKPKPNTRFLQNVLRGTKFHNESLLAKEAAEAHARLTDLSDAHNERERRHRPSAKETRGRQLGNIAAIIGGAGQKRKRDDKARMNDGEASGDRKAARGRIMTSEGMEKSSGAKRRRSLERYDVRRSRDGDSERKHKSRDRSRETSRTTREKGDSGRARRSHRQDRSRSPQVSKRKNRERSPLESQRSDNDVRETSKATQKQGRFSRSERRLEAKVEDSDTDPLDDLVGPMPLKSQQRGSPAVEDDREKDDWDDALEAVRMRNRWRQQGAERLREAGFTDAQIKSWEKGGEKSIDDVKWSKAGEEREWDRGKKLDLK